MDVKRILQWAAAILGSALIAGAKTAWEVIQAQLQAGGSEAFTSGTIEGIIVYALMVVSVFLGGWAIRKIPTKTEPSA